TDPAPTVIYSLSLHDALPISAALAGLVVAGRLRRPRRAGPAPDRALRTAGDLPGVDPGDGRAVRGSAVPLLANLLRRGRVPARRSEEHTSELQSLAYLVCRLL